MYQLTHIETDIRNKMAENSDDSKVHEKKDSIVENNTEGHSEAQQNSKQKKKKSKFFTVDAVNYNAEDIDVIAEKGEEGMKNIQVGMFIDNLK